MLLSRILIFIGLSLSIVSEATTFMRVSVEAQIEEAEGVFIGHYLGQRSVQVEDGQIATQMVFKLSKEYGLNSEFFGLDEIFVHYPGGTWGDETVVVDGVPRFNLGERVAILAKNIDNRLWGLNLALGSFRVVNYGNETLLINGVFPKDPDVSQIKIADFENKIKSIKGSSLKVVRSLELLDNEESSKGKNRSIASIDAPEENEVEQTSRPGTFWLLAFLAVTGAIASYRVKNKR